MDEFEQILRQISCVSYNEVLDELLLCLIRKLDAKEAVFCFYSQSNDIICLVTHKHSEIEIDILQSDVCHKFNEFPILTEFIKENVNSFKFTDSQIILPFIKSKSDYALIQSINFGTVSHGFFIITKDKEDFTDEEKQSLLYYVKIARTHLKL